MTQALDTRVPGLDYLLAPKHNDVPLDLGQERENTRRLIGVFGGN